MPVRETGRAYIDTMNKFTTATHNICDNETAPDASNSRYVTIWSSHVCTWQSGEIELKAKSGVDTVLREISKDTFALLIGKSHFWTSTAM